MFVETNIVPLVTSERLHRAALRACQEYLLMRNLDVAVFSAVDLAELLDDEGIDVSPTRVRSHMAYLASERPDLVSRVAGRWAWVVKLAGYPDLAS